MGQIMLVLSTALACGGTWLILSFIYFRVTSHLIIGEITGFQQRRTRRPQPVVKFIYEGAALQKTATHVDQLGYVMNLPDEKTRIAILYKPAPRHQVRVYGYMKLVSGLLLTLPIMTALAVQYGKGLVYTQSLFVFVFVGLFAGAWILLKFIQKHY